MAILFVSDYVQRIRQPSLHEITGLERDWTTVCSIYNAFAITNLQFSCAFFLGALIHIFQSLRAGTYFWKVFTSKGFVFKPQIKISRKQELPGKKVKDLSDNKTFVINPETV